MNYTDHIFFSFGSLARDLLKPYEGKRWKILLSAPGCFSGSEIWFVKRWPSLWWTRPMESQGFKCFSHLQRQHIQRSMTSNTFIYTTPYVLIGCTVRSTHGGASDTA